MMESNINKVNQYMRMGERMLNTHSSVPNPIANLGEIGKILKNRNEKYGNKKKITNPQILSLEEKLKKQVWAIEISKTQEEEQENLKEVRKKFSHPPLTISNQQSFMNSHLQFKIHETFTRRIKDQTKGKEQKFKQYIINKLKGYKYQEQSISRLPSKIKEPVKKQYNKLIKASVQQKNINLMLQKLSYSQQNEIWKIFQEQVKQYEFLKSQNFNPRIGIFLTSLRILQEKFNVQLPLNISAVNQFVKRNYMEKNLQYKSDKNGIFQWGVAYAYLRAGNYRLFYTKLSQLGGPGIKLRQGYMRLQDSMRRFEPEPVQFYEDNLDDVFYKQLVHILKGQALFVSIKMFKKNSNDLIWLLIKTLGIYSDFSAQKDQTFRKLCHKVSEQYQELEFKNFQNYCNLIYLGAYSKIPELHEKNKRSEFLNGQEYIHFLIVLSENDSLLDDSTALRKKLTDELIRYIRNLMKRSQPLFLYYIILIPEQQIKSSLKSLVNTFKHFQTIDSIVLNSGKTGWEYIKEQIKERGYKNIFHESFSQIVFQLTQKISNLEQSQWLSVKCSQILQNNTLPSKILLFSLCQYIIQSKEGSISIDSENEQKICTKLKSQITKNSTDKNLKQTTEFVIFYLHLMNSVKIKNVPALKKIVDTENYTKDLVLLSSKQNNSFKEFIKCLQSYGGIKILFYYLQKYLLAIELAYSQTHNISKIRQSQQMLLSTLKKIPKERSNYEEYKKIMETIVSYRR